MALDPKSPRARKGARVKFFIMIALIISVMSTTIVYAMQAGFTEPTTYLVLAPLAAIILLLLPILRRLDESARLGLPVEDERSRAIGDRAGALTYYVSIYIWLAISMFGRDVIDAGAASGIAIMSSAILYLGLRVALRDRES